MEEYSLVEEISEALPEEEEQEVYQGVYVVYDDSRPFLETKFSEYTVGEGLLLMLIVGLYLFALVKIIYSGFKWLR